MTTPAPESAQPNPAPGTRPTPRWQERIKVLIVEYGLIALVVWYFIFGTVLVSFALAIRMGFNVNVKVESTAGAVGTWGATWLTAYLATKLTTPLRLAATLAITPAIGKFVRRFRKRSGPSTPPAQLP